MIVIVTGPVRSGKSARAAHLAAALGRPVTYVATARVDPTDAEMTERVARHRADRGALQLIELWQPGVPDLPTLIASAAPDTTLLIDSLGTWVAGHLLELEALAGRDAGAARAQLEARTEGLVAPAVATAANLVLVSEETGWGLVPPSALGRIFRDHLGRLVQRVALHADRVELVIAGFALDLRALGVPILGERLPGA